MSCYLEMNDALIKCCELYYNNNHDNEYNNTILKEYGLKIEDYEINIDEIIKIPTKFRKYLIKTMKENINLIESKYISYHKYNLKYDIYDEKIKTLYLGSDYFEFNEFENNIPETITHLKIFGYNNECQYRILDMLPNSIKHLTLIGCEIINLDNLPNSIKYLEINGCYNTNNSLILNNIPNSVEVLKIDEEIKELIFPFNLKKIYFDYGIPLHRIENVEKIRKENCVLKLFYDDFENNYDEESEKIKFKNVELTEVY